MYEIIRQKARGLKGELTRFAAQVEGMRLTEGGLPRFIDAAAGQMRQLGFDAVKKDAAGNLIGVIKGQGRKGALLLISHIDLLEQTTAGSNRIFRKPGDAQEIAFATGIATSIYAGGLLKRALTQLEGDVVVACVPRTASCEFGVTHLFDSLPKGMVRKIGGVVLCEPTGFNVHLGNKGRIEYEIVVKGRIGRSILQNRGVNMLGAMFPLINELEKAARALPADCELGSSSLTIKDVRYGGYDPADEYKEFRVVVDREFVPEENPAGILQKAKTIGKNVYKDGDDVQVSTLLATSRAKTYTGLEYASKKEFKPWKMEGSHPFVGSSLEALQDNGFRPAVGYWKRIVTDGSYTCGELRLPTIGFGAGSEESIDTLRTAPGAHELERAILGYAAIIERQLAVPAFGWSADEI